MKCIICQENKIGFLLWIRGIHLCKSCEESLVLKRENNLTIKEKQYIKELGELENEKNSNN